MVAADLLVRIRAAAPGSTTFALEAELADGSRFSGPEFALDRAALLASEQAADQGVYGRLLFGALFAGSILTAYQQSIPAPGMDGLLRVRLVVDDAGGELDGLRWERMYRERRGTWVPLAASGDSPFSRYRSLPYPEPLPIATLPIRILLVVANPTELPSGLAEIAVEEEIRVFRDALSEAAATDSAEVTILPGRTGLSGAFRAELEGDGFAVADGPSTLPELVRRLSGIHIVHLIGHGGFRRETSGEAAQSALYLESTEGAWEPATADQLVTALAAAEDPPGLIYLSACESARSADDLAHPFVALAPRLVDAGAAAVIAMQDAVPVSAARSLTRTFYAHLLATGVVDLSLNEARSVLAAEGDLDWSIPVLVSRLRQGRLLVRRDLAQRVVSGDIAVTPGAAHGTLADRIVDVGPPRPRPRPVLLLPRDFADLLGREVEIDDAMRELATGDPMEFHGTAGIGKSALLRHLSNLLGAATPDGVVFVPRAGEPVHDVLQFVFDAMYESDASIRPTDAELERLLANVSPVVVLDNADVPREALERLIALLPKGRLLLATGERNLWGEGTVVELGGLAEAQALTLFERELGRVLAGSERERAQQLCRNLVGHPLHILQAAAQARKGTWPGPDLTRPPVADLPPLEQQVLAVVAAVSAPVYAETLVGVIGSPGVEAAATALEEKGLLRSASPKYVLAEPLTEAELSTLNVPIWRRHVLAYFVKWIEQHRNSPARLVRDLDAILAVADGPAALEAPHLGLRLLRGAEAGLILSKRFERWGALLQRQEELAAAAGPDLPALGWVRHQQGTRALALGDTAGARASLGEALKIREGLKDAQGAAVTRHNLELLGPVGPTSGDDRRPARSRLRRLLDGLQNPPTLLVGSLAVLAIAVLAWLLLIRPSRPLPVLPAISYEAGPIDLGTVEIGQRAERQVTITNASDVDLIISSVALDPVFGGLSVAGCTGTFSPRGTCQMNVSFAPTVAGDLEANLVIDDNTLESRHTLLVLAQGVARPGQPAIAMNPTTLDFGAIQVNSDANILITIASTGSAGLTVEDVVPPTATEFRILEDGCSNQTMPAGASCSINVGFHPSGQLLFVDRLLILESSQAEPHELVMSGSGLIGLADLTTNMDVVGDWIDQGDGTVALPVIVIARNEGDAAAAPFFFAGQVHVPDQEADVFLIPLPVDPDQTIIQGDASRPLASEPLEAGESVTFLGRLVFGSFFAGRHAVIRVASDSCEGEEVFDPVAAVSCRVVEIDETNNLSNDLELDIPPRSGDTDLGLFEGGPLDGGAIDRQIGYIRFSTHGGLSE
jgi:CHAT domain/Abnormal spindle-like microcephaly-assoc'd, ASPM-SPD-2-Hydin